MRIDIDDTPLTLAGPSILAPCFACGKRQSEIRFVYASAIATDCDSCRDVAVLVREAR